MSVILGIIAFFVILTVLILVHEIGHFSMAKLFGVRVHEFALGFPPRLKTWERGGTLYSINAIPLGGYVRMLGENGEDLEPDAFGAKPHWQRFLVLFAGPGVNIALALALFWGAFVVGSPQASTMVDGVSPGSPAAQAGLRAHDRIVAVDGIAVHDGDALQAAVRDHAGEQTVLLVKRGASVLSVMLVPRANPPKSQGRLGVLLHEVTVKYGAVEALRRAVGGIGTAVGQVPMLVTALSHHDTSAVNGPIGIAHTTTLVVQNEPRTGIGFILWFGAVLSASLGILNLLPMPALDGGRIVFVLISWIRRRNLDPEIEGVIHMVGMAALLMLIVVISYQDLSNWISGKGF